MVQFRFFDPGNTLALGTLASRLDREEGGYFRDMRVEPKRKMDAKSFVRLLHPWTDGDRRQYERHIFPHTQKAIDAIMTKVVGRRVRVLGTIAVARLDTSVEHSFPFTLVDHIFLSMPRASETLTLKRKTLVHEACHILQRYFPGEFHNFYLRLGFMEVPCHWIKRVRTLADTKYESISNPDTWRHRVYGVPLKEDHSAFLVTNLAVDPKDGYYRELGFLVEDRNIVDWQWLQDMMPHLYEYPGLPAKSKDVLKLIARRSMEGHPNETSARIFESIGLI